MHRTFSRLLLSAALAVTLSACTTTPAPLRDDPVACRETGLTNGPDSKMGQLDCAPARNPTANHAN
jgi:ABC-type uncharacterized transport system auxiliary subunit